MPSRPRDCLAATSVAQALVQLAEERGRSLTPLQIIKLVYIAHGFWLALKGEPLVRDSAEAWPYGPVFPRLYRVLSPWGRQGVPADALAAFQSEELTDEHQGLITTVLEKYGHLNGLALSHLTHREGTPWSQVQKGDSLDRAIPNPIIKEHYAALLEPTL
ncbi:MAG: type II toxin-antitoxin system antitoxin SocA domain-containing protein [Pseudomonadota bacterium]